MNDFNYYVYDNGDLVCGFVSLCAATSFCEEWRHNGPAPIDLVDSTTGEILDTWANGRWENGSF